MPKDDKQTRNILERLSDVFRVLTSQVPLKEAQRLGLPELTGLPAARLPGELQRRETTRAREAQLLTEPERALYGARLGVEPGKFIGVRQKAAVPLLPSRRTGRSVYVDLLREKRDLLRAKEDKNLRRYAPALWSGLDADITMVNEELDRLRGRQRPAKEPEAKPAEEGVAVGKDVETQLGNWIKTKPRIKSQKRIAGILYEYRGGDNIAIVKR